MSNKPTVKQAHKAEIAYKYYINEGWTPEQASGIVGSLVTESGNFNEDVITGKRLGDGGKAFGIAQWHSNRQSKAKELYGDKWKDFNNQLAFVNWELNNTESKAGKKLKSSKTVWEAGTTFANEYERPKLKFHADDKRQNNVADVYNKYSKSKLTEDDKKLFLDSNTSYANSVAPYIENTLAFINFETPKNNTNFADVADVYIEQKQEVSEPLQKLKENSFLEEYAQLQGQQPQFIQQYEQPTPIMTTDVYGMAENVERMVAQQGTRVDMYGNKIEAPIQYKDITRSFYDSRRGVINIGEDYKKLPPEEQEGIMAHENRHDWQYKNDRSNFNITHNPDYAFNEKLQKKPGITDTDEVYDNYHNRQQIETDSAIKGIKENYPEFSFTPDQVMYDKGITDYLYDDKFSIEGEAQYYQKTGEKSFQQGGEKNSLWKNIRANRGSGKKPTKEMLEQEAKIKRAQQGIIKDDEGYWNPENRGKVVEIQGSEITMKNVYEPLLGISNQTGERKIMLPNKNYSFSNTKQVTEYPIITEKERAFINKYKNKK